jgi:hypothetical protein
MSKYLSKYPTTNFPSLKEFLSSHRLRVRAAAATSLLHCYQPSIIFRGKTVLLARALFEGKSEADYALLATGATTTATGDDRNRVAGARGKACLSAFSKLLYDCKTEDVVDLVDGAFKLYILEATRKAYFLLATTYSRDTCSNISKLITLVLLKTRQDGMRSWPKLCQAGWRSVCSHLKRQQHR